MNDEKILNDEGRIRASELSDRFDYSGLLILSSLGIRHSSFPPVTSADDKIFALTGNRHRAFVHQPLPDGLQ